MRRHQSAEPRFACASAASAVDITCPSSCGTGCTLSISRRQALVFRGTVSGLGATRSVMITHAALPAQSESRSKHLHFRNDTHECKALAIHLFVSLPSHRTNFSCAYPAQPSIVQFVAFAGSHRCDIRNSQQLAIGALRVVLTSGRS